MKKIMIVCQCASNKGDRAIAEFIILQLKKIDDIRITLSTTEPQLWRNLEDIGVNVIPMGYKSTTKRFKNKYLIRALRNIDKILYDKMIYPDLINLESKHKKCLGKSSDYIKKVKDSDLVIITGGHHITSIRNKNALFSFTYDIGLTFLYAQKFLLWSQTIGPLEFSDKKVEIFFEQVIGNADKVYIRDKNSEECIKKYFGKCSNIVKSYDSVFGFGDSKYTDYKEREKKVGISIFNGLKKAFHTYENIAELLDWYVDKGYSIEFFRMEYDNQEELDIRRIIKLMKTEGKIIIFPFMTSTEEHLKELATCKYYIGYKTHSIIMSLTTATPLIAIAYHQKSFDFMRDYEIEKYAISDEKLTTKDLISIATKIEKNGEEIHQNMRKRSSELAKIISDDFKRNFNYEKS